VKKKYSKLNAVKAPSLTQHEINMIATNLGLQKQFQQKQSHVKKQVLLING